MEEKGPFVWRRIHRRMKDDLWRPSLTFATIPHYSAVVHHNSSCFKRLKNKNIEIIVFFKYYWFLPEPIPILRELLSTKQPKICIVFVSFLNNLQIFLIQHPKLIIKPVN